MITFLITQNSPFKKQLNILYFYNRLNSLLYNILYCHNFQIVFQEVPGEISLCFSISGCKLRCKGCHSPFLWKEGKGKLLTQEYYTKLLNRYKNYATCVLFMGGEWHELELIEYLKIANEKEYKTCLYTGEETVSEYISAKLTWLKTGKWIEHLGGLESVTTNQKFIEIKTKNNLNQLFQKTF